MSPNPVCLVIHSTSSIGETKPNFRIVAVEQTNLPFRFNGYNHKTYNYIDVRVTTTQIPIVGEWNIKMETENLSGYQVAITAASDSLEVAGKELAEEVKGDIANKVVAGSRLHQKDSATGNPTVHYSVVEEQEDEVGLIENIHTWHWWEIIKVKLVWGDVYGVQFNEKARQDYAVNAASVAFLSTRKRYWGSYGEQGERQLEQLRKRVGYVNVEPGEFERVVARELSDET